MAKNLGKKRSTANLVAIAIFTLMSLFFIFLLAKQLTPGREKGNTIEEINAADLSQELVCIDGDTGQWYPGLLLEPGDFEGERDYATDSAAKFGTNRIVLQLEPGRSYGISGASASYAQRVWINGELVSEVGVVSDSPQGFVPATEYYTVYFTPDSPETELVIQRAHFNHISGYLNALHLGEQQLVIEHNSRLYLFDGLLVGMLLGIAIFFFSMFLFFNERHELAWFAAACFCVALHYLIYENKTIMTIFPNLSWALSHKLELIAQYGYFFFMFLYGYKVIGVRPAKWFSRLSIGIYMSVVLMICLTPSIFYTRYAVPGGALVSGILVVNCIYLLAMSYRPERRSSPENAVAAITILIVTLCWMLLAVTYLGRSLYLWHFATLLFVYLNAANLTVRFSRVEKRLGTAEKIERELRESNMTLDRLGKMKTETLANISHEMKTPLTIISANAQLSKKLLDEGGGEQELKRNLDVVQMETGRLSRLISDAVAFSSLQETQGHFTRVDIRRLLTETTDIYRVLTQKRGNKLLLHMSASLPPVYGNGDQLVQVLVNLLSNANKHTSDGEISVYGQHERDRISITVRDTGAGISPEVQAHMFERYYKNSREGAGLGLSICKDIVRQHGGEIYVDSRQGRGTSISFILPIQEEVEIDE